MLFEPKAPSAVGENHQFSNQQIERRAAAAAFDVNNRILAIALKRKIPIHASRRFGTSAHLFTAVLQTFGKMPQPSDLVRIRDGERISRNRFLGDQIIDFVVAQICLQCDPLQTCLSALDGKCVVLYPHIK